MSGYSFCINYHSFESVSKNVHCNLLTYCWPKQPTLCLGQGITYTLERILTNFFKLKHDFKCSPNLKNLQKCLVWKKKLKWLYLASVTLTFTTWFIHYFHNLIKVKYNKNVSIAVFRRWLQPYCCCQYIFMFQCKEYLLKATCKC